MAEVRCADGRRLGIRPEPVVDRDGVPYEVVLNLTLDDAAFGCVGERCGYFLATAAARLRAARETGGADAFPASTLEAGLRAWAADEGHDADAAWRVLERYVPRDRELFCFHARDPDDPATAGQLRVSLQHQRHWRGGRWVVRPRAVLDAWGEAGTGVRCLLDSAQLLALLEELVRDCAAVGVRYDATDGGAAAQRPAG